MFRLVLVSGLLAVALGGTIPEPSGFGGKIIGGEETTIEQFPYQVSLRHFSIAICGGTIINANTIVTAAHCTYEKTAKYLTVRAGSTSNENGGQVIQVAQVIPHEKYNRLNQDYDICILKLEKPLEFGPGVQPAPMQEEGEDVPAGTTAVISGWGRTQAGNSSSGPENLRKVEVSVITQEECKAKYDRPITARMLCCTSNGKDSCQGDSGGPLVANKKLIGVVSWGQGCGNPKYAGVYAKVSELRPWIDGLAKA